MTPFLKAALDAAQRGFGVFEGDFSVEFFLFNIVVVGFACLLWRLSL